MAFINSMKQAEILNEIMAKITQELQNAILNDEIDSFVEKYDITCMTKETYFIDERNSKILVIGYLSGNVNDYYLSAKKIGIPEYQIEFIYDDEKIKSFNASKLYYTSIYSDVICGPMPHKMIGIGNFSSLISMLESDKEAYPNIIRAQGSNELKLSQTSFKKAIESTRLYKTKILNY